ncbi:phosphate acyltransferase PlsX [bacterium]|nr:phosphate acyltransferase PlsX [bacterium]MCG2676844.1 phosphate acyltransferase PlsX [bacterium]
MRIALDAMGGDRAPGVIVEGAIQALKEYKDLEIILVGDEKRVKKELAKYSVKGISLSIVHASQVVEMDELPTTALRKKKDSSIMVAARLVKEKKAQAIVSAGNTGAAMVATKVVLGTLEGIERPAIAILMPHIHGVSILTDVGANVDCKPQHLLQFAIMGNTYAKEILEIEKPKVGLLSVGKERVKGNELTRTTYDLLEKTSLNFIGNVEGRDIFNGSVDVIVCDGFIGNVVLKTAESLAETIQGMLKKEITKNFLRKLGALLSMGAYRAVKKRIDYSEYGGAPLLGINGVCIITHGGAPALAIKNTLRVAGEFIDHKVNAHIIESIKGEKI